MTLDVGAGMRQNVIAQRKHATQHWLGAAATGRPPGSHGDKRGFATSHFK